MRAIPKVLRVVIVAAIMLGAIRSLQADDLAALNNVWRGTWTSPQGYLYEAEMHLSVLADASLTGKIIWTLKKSPHESERSKLNLTGTEYVAGNFDPVSRVLLFEGVRKDDPHAMIGLDKYKLLLADNSNVIGGITWNHGSWQGALMLSRVEAAR